MQTLELARGIVGASLQLGPEAERLDRDTQLLGGFPEFNSLTITAIVAAIEDELDCEIDDAEITGEIFETLGTLADFISTKLDES
jgi:acyl carrier protein